MGFFDRFKKPSYLGTTADELGDDFDEVVRRLAKALLKQEPVIETVRDALVICRSPVLVIIEGEVRQPAALIPKAMLSRFWAEREPAVGPAAPGRRARRDRGAHRPRETKVTR